MSKKFIKEVHKELEDLGYHIEYCGSDMAEKMGLFKPKPIPTETFHWFRDRFTSICEFVVRKKGGKEYFVVWDWRENQPYYRNEFCTYKGSFGRYNFQSKSDFFNHIGSDYGLPYWEKIKIEHNQL